MTTLREDFTTRSKIADLGRWYVTQFVRSVAPQLPQGALLLDAGAGECAYKRFFPHCRYAGVDLAVGQPAWNYHNLDCIATLDRLPFADATFDAVLSTQTLEHLQNPQRSLCELYRVLKTDGQLFLTAPMAHAEHQTPYDFFRYTSYGLRFLCERAGFSHVCVMPFGGMFARWAYELPTALDVMPRSGLFERKPTARGSLAFPFKVIAFALIRAMQTVLILIDRFDRRREFPFGWSVVATKTPCTAQVSKT
ncbi:MAG: class I SAM-dependent methyltransferase [Chloroflexi bacterium]|nr:class I SAM-dependent methyltransferase [Chloroflexota bacterium]